MGMLQRRLLIQQEINLAPHAVARMVGRDTLVRVDNGREAPCQVQQLFEHLVVDAYAGETSHVLETCGCPVVDDVEGEETCTDRVEPPDVCVVAD